jgi:hypothetical protein
MHTYHLALLALAAPATAAPFQSGTVLRWDDVALQSGLQLTNPIVVSGGDLDGDGEVDVVLADVAGPLRWFEAQAGAPSVEHVLLPGVTGFTALDVADLDGDGDLDVLVGRTDAAEWLENDGAGGGWARHTVPQPFSGLSEATVAFTLGDLDGDADLDLVWTMTPHIGNSDRSVHVYRNQGGAFTRTTTLYGSGPLGEPTLADLDGDGDLDVFVSHPSFSPSPWHRNDTVLGGPIALTSTGAIPHAAWPLPTDFDGDGDVDLVLVTGSLVHWSRNLGQGAGFSAPIELIGPHPVPGNRFIYEARLADIDLDGDDDLILSVRPSNTAPHETLNRIAWHENLGDETLGPRHDLVPVPFFEHHLGFWHGDMDSDGDPDVVAVERNTGNLVAYLDGATLGFDTCPGVPNSSGAAGTMRAQGSIFVGRNDVTLRAFDLPVGAVGYMLTAPSAGSPFTPSGSVGTICIGGGIGRYAGPGQILVADGAGSFSLPISLGAIPTPNGFIALVPGDTRHFQCWHRDSSGGAPTSNFTGAIAVTFR